VETRTIIVAVGSTRRPKLKAVEAALERCGEMLRAGARFEIVGIEAPSGVRHTPLSRADIMAGARNRAEALKRMAAENSEPWEYFLGLEGGFDVVVADGQRQVFLENWAYVLDKAGRGAFGQSGAVAVPSALARAVVDEGVELAEAVDAFAGGRGIRDAQGAWGVLTGNLMTRQEAFRIAVINAFAPFYNPLAYGPLAYGEAKAQGA